MIKFIARLIVYSPFVAALLYVLYQGFSRYSYEMGVGFVFCVSVVVFALAWLFLCFEKEKNTLSRRLMTLAELNEAIADLDKGE
ncbi:MAG: hypothetical protein JKY81_01600 [Colwellia sp.]|nr:hypothetical protein [Colwellia sp.]